MWYDKTELLSRKTLLNLLGGGRGTGKTLRAVTNYVVALVFLATFFKKVA